MGDKKHILEEPAVFYGKKIKIRDIVPVPMENAEEYLRSQGYISFEELKENLSKYL